jgi:phosphoribosylformimino-5-aminoimidazole carboxamide ribotide isomerase
MIFMRFRPCIDLHQGKVKQIVGGTLSDSAIGTLQTNFEADKPADWFARRYRQDGLTGGHVIQLGTGNTEAARVALAAWPQGFQLGGGVTADNAVMWLEAGAAAVIVTSWVFHDGAVDQSRLDLLVKKIGRRRLVLDLSCRRKGRDYYIVTNRWQTFTREKISLKLLDRLSGCCAEYLIHAVDVEGRCQGVEQPLVRLLGRWHGLPITYAGGIRSMEDIALIEEAGNGRIDFTVGSALDIFGGKDLSYTTLARQFGSRGLGCRTSTKPSLRRA